MAELTRRFHASSENLTDVTKKRSFTTMTRKLRNNTKRRLDRNQSYTGFSVKTGNRFAALQEHDIEMDDWNDEHLIPRNSKISASKSKVIKPPPIKITDDRLNTANIKKYITDLDIKSFQTKGMSIGIKVDLDELEDHAKLIEKLKSENIAFFTHSASDQKLFKVVLSGLPKINTNIIVDELKRYNITPSSITELSTSNVNPKFCLYLVQLPKNDISLGQLRKIRAIDHIVVEWKPFKPRNKGPTQCKRCAMLGHGAQNCHRKEACLICASTQHVVDNCPFKEETNEAFVYKCFNCASKKLANTQHRANDPNCPSRIEYLEIRNKINHRNSIRNSNLHHNNTFKLNQDNFPNLNRNAGFKASTQSIGPTYAEKLKSSPANDGLYSMEDLSEILYETVDELMACTNKGQQLKVLFKLLSNAFK